MQCLQAPLSDLSVLERQRARLTWQQQGQEQPASYSPYDGGYCPQNLLPMQASFQAHHKGSGCKKNQGFGNILGSIDCFYNGWSDLGSSSIHYPVPSAASVEETSANLSNNSLRKRKAENSPKSKQQENGSEGKGGGNCKRIKEESGTATSEAKQSNHRKEASGDASKENEKPPKTDYIHVRARRGQATDSHSLAERVRRERISQRMKYLQDLVPGCSKITGKAGMLDEIINYVQSLQRQVEFLSMKLAAVNPMMDVNIDNFFGREINPAAACKAGSIPMMGMSSDQVLDQSYLQLQNAHPCSGLDMFIDSSDLALGQTVNLQVSVPPDASFGSCLSVNGSSSVWNTNLQSLYGVECQLGRGTPFPFQSLQGNLLPNNLKMEM